MPPTKYLISVLAILAAMGCQSTKKKPHRGRPIQEVYREAQKIRPHPVASALQGDFRLEKPGGKGQPYAPRLIAPETWSVWVMPHQTLKGVVSVEGHWVQIKLRESRWLHEVQPQGASYGLERLRRGVPFSSPPEQKTKPASQPAPEPVLEDVQVRAGVR